MQKCAILSRAISFKEQVIH